MIINFNDKIIKKTKKVGNKTSIRFSLPLADFTAENHSSYIYSIIHSLLQLFLSIFNQIF